MKGAESRGWIVAAALSGAISVIVGAFAAHGLDAGTEAGAKARGWLQTGSQYQAVHALAMLATAALANTATIGGRMALAAQGLFLAGSILFPGALYALAFEGPRWFGAVAPIGGLALIAGWVSLAIAALTKPKRTA